MRSASRWSWWRHALGRVDHEQRGVGAVDGLQRARRARSTRSARRCGSDGACLRCRRTAAGRRRSRPRCRPRRGWCRARSCTIERSSPTSRLNSVDLPTFGPADDRDREESVVGSSASGASGGRRQHVDQGVEQVTAPPSVDGRHRVRGAEAESRERPGLVLAAFVVDLVGDEEDGLLRPLEDAGDLSVLLGDADVDVDDHEDDVGVGDGAFGLAADPTGRGAAPSPRWGRASRRCRPR